MGRRLETLFLFVLPTASLCSAPKAASRTQRPTAYSTLRGVFEGNEGPKRTAQCRP